MDFQHAVPVCPPEVLPIPYKCAPSSVSLSIVAGPTLTLWTSDTVTKGNTEDDIAVKLQPDNPVVIGRQEGGRIKYLDARYQPTRMAPNSSRPVVTSLCGKGDICVSRGHFMLKSSPWGVLLTNGVPRPDGTIRPPLNGTILLEPVYRWMGRGEEYLIPRGTAVRIRLPNGTVVRIGAE